MRNINQQRRKLLAPPFIAARCKGAKRVAMIALPPGDHMAARGVAPLQMVLPRQLDRRLGRL